MNLTYYFIRYIKKLMTSPGHVETDVINLSRIDPNRVGLKKLWSWSNTSYIGYASSSKGALCFSVAIVTEDRTREPRIATSKEHGEFKIKELIGILHALEYERLVATICLVNKTTCFQSQIVDQFTTFGSKPPIGNNQRKGMTLIFLLGDISHSHD